MGGKTVAFDVRRGRMPQIQLPEESDPALEEAAGSVGHGRSFVCPGTTRAQPLQLNAVVSG